MEFRNRIICGDWVDVLEPVPEKTVHCVVTSPPYWGQRNYGVEGQLGLEKTPEEHIEKLVRGFRQVRRVLRDDGVVWLNYGDAYAREPKRGIKFQSGPSTYLTNRQAVEQNLGPSVPKGAKEKDLLGLAWRLALALQADGWYLRSDTVWVKAVSFCETYSGSTMPESVNGWRWERHRVKVKKGDRAKNAYQQGAETKQGPGLASRAQRDAYFENGVGATQWVVCPGCAVCEPNDGLVLRCGSWRPTRAHEYLFLLAKSGEYYCDMEAVKEKASENTHPYGTKLSPPKEGIVGHRDWTAKTPDVLPSRNLRDCWAINPQAYPEAHYATFPEKLVEPCIKAGTSEKGCCSKCGAPWVRIVNKETVRRERPADRTERHAQGNGVNSCGNTVAGVDTQTLGWRSVCGCGAEVVPCVVLDPFAGSGTTCAVAARLGRDYIGIELNPEYIEKQAILRVAEAEHGVTVREQKTGQGILFGTGVQ